VTSILPVASNAARNFTVRVDFKVADRRLRPQMFARGSILIDTHKNAVLVPKDAVLYDPVNNRTRVFVAKGDNQAEERQVSIGYSNTQYVEILSGIRENEKVIVVGQNGLQNGDKIKVQ
jgi:RND family efflux transporter MFP subunit